MKDCQIGLLWISLFTTFLVVTVCEPNPEESNVCSRLINRLETYVTSCRTSYQSKTTTWCWDAFDLFKCTKYTTKYRQVYCTATRIKSTTEYYCCQGYEETPEHTCDPVCISVCVHGTCVRPFSCSCDAGWGGYNCNQALCTPVCEHGTCVAPDTCSCDAGWGGDSCNEVVCTSGCEHGTCVAPNTCSCDAGWRGESCNEAVCTSVCEHGTCVAPNTCSCDAGWRGDSCNEVVCTSGCEHGTCVAPDTCSCDAGWRGDSCNEDTSSALSHADTTKFSMQTMGFICFAVSWVALILEL